MSEPTLESLAKRVAALEAALASLQPRKGWRDVVGMFGGSEIMKRVDEEGRRIREAEREAARQGADGAGA